MDDIVQVWEEVRTDNMIEWGQRVVVVWGGREERVLLSMPGNTSLASICLTCLLTASAGRSHTAANHRGKSATRQG